MISNSKRLSNVIVYFDKKPWLLFLFFAALIFLAYKKLFLSYFESDEWPLFTFYLPLTRTPDGLLTAFLSEILQNGALSGNQHVIPVASTIYFLNVFFFGLNFTPYAFIALFLHATNCFLIFLLVKSYFKKKESNVGFIFGVIAGIFFAFSQSPVHAYTGAAPFYGQNVLSITFFLLCILSFRKAFALANKKYIYFTIVFLFLALLTKETTAFLFLLLPIIAIFEKRVFPLKYLLKLFIIVSAIYFVIRFVVPYTTTGNLAGSSGNPSAVENVTDTETIVSRDTSVHKNIYKEIAFRSLTFPTKMLSEAYFPFQTVQSMMVIATSIAYPQLEGSNDPNRSQNTLVLINGPGNDLMVYFLSFIILILVISVARRYFISKEYEKFQAILTGLAILILSALPLVMIVLAFPRWGYDTYFDSRHYYIPTVGAAILFPFLLFGIGVILSNLFKAIRLRIGAGIFMVLLFLIWLMNSVFVLQKNMHIIVDLTGIPRREIIKQMKQTLPGLPTNVVIHTETDGGGAYGPVLPFQTSVPQALSVAYYDSNPLPDAFFKSFIFGGKPEGYMRAEGRGFGYYSSKKTLADALLAKKFAIDDVYSFYYDSRTVQVADRTAAVRDEMKKYLEKRKEMADWKRFTASTSAETITFLSPPSTEMVEVKIASTEAAIVKEFTVTDPQFSGDLTMIRTSPTYDINESETLNGKLEGYEVIQKKVSFDEYNFNDVYVAAKNDETKYMVKFNDLLVVFQTPTTDPAGLETIEKMLGSLIVKLNTVN